MRFGALTRLCTALLSVLWVLGGPQAVSAHAVLLESTPRASDTVSEAGRLDLRFNSRLEQAFSEVRLSGPSGDRAPLQVRSSRGEPNRLTVPLPALDAGLYTVHWRVLTMDGHLTHGSFSFRLSVPRP